MILILVLIACIIGYFLIRFWIRLINFIFKPIEKILENRQKENESNQVNNIEKVEAAAEEEEKEISISNFGEFDIRDFPEKYRTEPFYFYEYYQPDGEWINIDDIICKIRIGENDGYRFKFVSILATKAGILVHILKKDDFLKDKTIFYKMLNKGEYQYENSIEKSEYKDYFKNFHNKKDSFSEWLVQDGAFVNIGEPVYKFKDSNRKECINYSKKAGFILRIHPNYDRPFTKYILMYIIREKDEQRIKEKFINEPNIIIDEFTNSTTIKWRRVSSKHNYSQGIKTRSDNSNIEFFFSLYFIDNSDFIIFQFDPKQIRPKQFDKVTFLFENKEQIEFELTSNPITIKNRIDEKTLEYKGIITKSELELFANFNFIKWKISLVNDKREILGGETSRDEFYLNKNNIQIVIKKFANDYMNLIKKTIPDYLPTELKQDEQINNISSGFCFVYLMHDTSNNYYKIGISNTPEYRERTLQSEKPTIEMIASKKFPIRKIAESIERALHDTYSEKRLRGEWFELDTKDVQHIKESLK